MPASVPRSDPALSLSLYRAAHHVRAASLPVVQSLGIQYEAYVVLAQLWGADGAHEPSIAAVLGLSPEALAARVDELVEGGYAEREARPDGTTEIWLTNEGHRAHALATRALGEWEALDDSDLADTRYFLDVLTRLLA